MILMLVWHSLHADSHATLSNLASKSTWDDKRSMVNVNFRRAHARLFARLFGRFRAISCRNVSGVFKMLHTGIYHLIKVNSEKDVMWAIPAVFLARGQPVHTLTPCQVARNPKPWPCPSRLAGSWVQRYTPSLVSSSCTVSSPQRKDFLASFFPQACQLQKKTRYFLSLSRHPSLPVRLVGWRHRLLHEWFPQWFNSYTSMPIQNLLKAHLHVALPSSSLLLPSTWRLFGHTQTQPGLLRQLNLPICPSL